MGRMKTLRKRNGQILRGHRFYIEGLTVNQVKAIVGKDAKKVQMAADGKSVEIIHTCNGSNRNQLFSKFRLLEKMK